MNRFLSAIGVLVCFASIAVAAHPLHVAILTGDEEYRSEESMPMIGKMLQRDFGAHVTIGFSVDGNGHVDPDAVESMTGTEAIEDADVLVLFLRFRRPSEEAFGRILAHLKAGKPVVGFRTSTHAFRFAEDSPHVQWGFQDDPTFKHSFAGGDLTRELLGQKWIIHHGHFSDGKNPLTDVSKTDVKHPILNGVEPFSAYSWLYHVQGGGDTIAGDPTILLQGKSLRSEHEAEGNTDRYPLKNPVAWTKTHQWGEKPGRVFMTTLGHPYDFRSPAMRRLAIQGILWAAGREDLIPEDGANTETVGNYEPNNSGFNNDFKPNMKPSDLF